MIWPYSSGPKLSWDEQRDAQIVSTTRNAPLWVLRRINEDRRLSGKPEFRQGQFRILHQAQRVREQGLGTLIGLACYGSSVATSCDWDRRRLPESFMPDAFAGSVAEISRGITSAWLSLNHTETELANTSDQSLSVRIHPRYGLEFWAKLKNIPAHRDLIALARSGKLAVSVGFTDPIFDTEPARGGGRRRVIRRAKLRHIALLDSSRIPPAYRAARVVHVWGTDPRAICNGLARARLAGYASAVEQRLPGAR